MLDLQQAYSDILKRLARLDFNALWPGFARLEFALYNDDEVVLNGKRLPKTEEFLANTAILYEGRTIAIWQLVEETDPDILTSKIVHEMFHGFQTAAGEKRFPSEFEAIVRYRYTPESLTLKYREDLLLASLAERFDPSVCAEFLSLRKTRAQFFPYEYGYDGGIEAIEGAAQYVELQTLKQLSAEKYLAEYTRLIGRLRRREALIPARILSYDVGALLLSVLLQNGLPVDQTIGETDAPYDKRTADGAASAKLPPVDPEIAALCQRDTETLRRKIDSIQAAGEPIARGDFELMGCNVYSARYLDGFAYSEYFLTYRDGDPVTLFGNFLFRLANGRVLAVWREQPMQ